MAKRKYPKLLPIIIAVCLLLCAAAAAVWGRARPVELSFDVDGEVTVLELARGECADTSALEAAAAGGGRFICWLDGEGNEAEPGLPAGGSAAYTALIAPPLTQNLKPWLSRDELGRALPDRLISGAELAEGAAALFDGALDASELASLKIAGERDLAYALRRAFRAEELEGLDGTEPLTRLEAAVLITRLAGLEPETPERAPAPDLPADRPGAAALAACLDPAGEISYDEGPALINGELYYVEDGLFVTDALAAGLYFDARGRCELPELEPGFVNLAGYLYCVGEDGAFVKNAEAGGLMFGADGRYSSGSAELDDHVAAVLADICAENESREDMLYAAYLYVRDGFQYLRRNFYTLGETGWEVEEALTMFETGRGNCYNYAAAFWALARGLGYDAVAVSGTLGWDYDRHGWVVIYDEDGTRLTYDVETEMAYRRDRVYTKNMFAMSPAYAAGWNYKYGG